MTDLFFKCGTQLLGRRQITLEIKLFDFLLDYPISHWVYVDARYVTSYTIGFNQRCAAAHKGVCNMQAMKIVRSVERFAQRGIHKLRKQ